MAIDRLEINIGSLTLSARWEPNAPRTVAFIKSLLPLEGNLLHARWSGEATWIPYGDMPVDGLGYENATSYPGPGELLFYTGSASEREILFPYGRCHFASTAGTLAGNHFATVDEGSAHLPEIGRDRLLTGGITVTLTASQ